MIRKHFYILLFLLGANLLHAQSFNFTNYSTDLVTQIVQKDNYIYVGSYNGVKVLDLNGNLIATYNKDNNSLPHNWVLSMAVDNAGNLWVGTYAGLAFFNGYKWEVIEYIEGGVSFNVKTLVKDTNGDVWASGSGIVYRFLKGADNLYSLSNRQKFTNVYVASIKGGINYCVLDKLGRPVFAQDGGEFFKFNGTTFERFTVFTGPAYMSPEVASLYTQGDTLWIGTRGYGLYYYLNGVTTQASYSLITSDYQINATKIKCITRDKSGTFWYATENGLFYKNKTGIYAENNSNSAMSFKDLNIVFVDSYKNIWAGTNGAGTLKRTTGGYQHFMYNIMSNYNMNTFARGNSVIFSFSRGVYTYSNNKWSFIKESYSDAEANYNIFIDKNNRFLYSNGSTLYRYNGTITSFLLNEDVAKITDDINGNIYTLSPTSYSVIDVSDNVTYFPNPLVDTVFTDMIVDKDGTIWLTVNYEGKIYSTNGIKYNVENFNIADGAAGSLSKDGDGNVYFFTSNHSVYKRIKGEWHRLSTISDKLPAFTYSCFSVDKNGNFWLGTDSKGIVYADTTNFQVYDDSNTNGALPQTSSYLGYEVRSIVFDGFNNKWINIPRLGIYYMQCNSPVPDLNIEKMCMGKVKFINNSQNVDNVTKYFIDTDLDGVTDFTNPNFEYFYNQSNVRYKVLIKAVNDNCERSHLDTFRLKALPTKPIISEIKPEFCPFDTILCSNVTLSNDYKWYFNNAPMTSDTLFVPPYSENAEFYLKVTNKTTLCENFSDTITLNMLAVSDAVITKKFDNLLICDNSDNTFVNYQWYNSFGPIQSANLQYFDVPVNGSYYVIATDINGCNVKSTDYLYGASSKMSVFPTTTSDIITLKLNFENENSGKIEIYNSYGQTVYYKVINISNSVEMQINVSDFQPGTYFVCFSGKTKQVERIVKL